MHRIWFYRPQLYWHGWSTLLPVARGHDEYARWTLMIGWTITGRIVIALGDCGDLECHVWRDRQIELDSHPTSSHFADDGTLCHCAGT